MNKLEKRLEKIAKEAENEGWDCYYDNAVTEQITYICVKCDWENEEITTGDNEVCYERLIGYEIEELDNK